MDPLHGTFGLRNFGQADLGDRRRTNRLVQVVEYGRSAIEQRTTVGSRRHTLGVAIEQTHAQCTFQFRNRSGNGGLGHIENDSALFMLPARSTAIRIWMSRSFMRLAM